MNKEEVFPLYVGNKKQQAECEGKTYDLTGYSSWTETCQLCTPIGNKKDSQYTGWRGVDKCQLILKPLKSMNYENWVELSGFVFDLKLVNETAITLRDLLSTGDGAFLSFKSMVKIMEWLMKNGYALDDNWFKGDNPIAVEP